MSSGDTNIGAARGLNPPVAPVDPAANAAPDQGQNDPGFAAHDGPPPAARLRRNMFGAMRQKGAAIFDGMRSMANGIRNLPARLGAILPTTARQAAPAHQALPRGVTVVLGDPTDTVHNLQNSFQPFPNVTTGTGGETANTPRDEIDNATLEAAGFIVVADQSPAEVLAERKGPRFSAFYSTDSDDLLDTEDTEAELTKLLFAEEEPEATTPMDKAATGPRNGGKLHLNTNLLAQDPVAEADTTDAPAAGDQERIQVRSPLLAQDPPATQDTDATAEVPDGNAEDSRYSIELKRGWDL